MSTILRTVTGIIVHQSDSPRDTTTIEEIDAWHKANGWGIQVGPRVIHCGYHWVVTGDGVAHVGRPASVIGAHAQGSNSHTIGICLTGNFAKGKDAPSAAQIKTLVQLCATYCKRAKAGAVVEGVLYKLTPAGIMGHRDVCATSCPGDLYQQLPDIRRQVAAYL